MIDFSREQFWLLLKSCTDFVFKDPLLSNDHMADVCLTLKKQPISQMIVLFYIFTSSV